MDNRALLWAKPDKAGILLKRGGERKPWKKRQFLLKDSYLFYFKVLASVEQSAPMGVIPLQGCKVGITPAGLDPNAHCIFIVTLPEELARLGILKHTSYVLAAIDYEDMQPWIDAIKLASLSKRKLQAKVDHASMEVRDLERRWAAAKERDSYREAGRDAPPVQFQRGEDPVILQALADTLMEAYNIRKLLQNRIKEAHTRSLEASSHLTVLERAASMKEELIMAQKDMRRLMSEIQSEMAACSESLEWLIPARFQYYNVERQVEALEGLCEDGEGIPLATDLEAILRETLNKLDNLEFQNRGDEELPYEKEIAELGAQLASIYEEYMAIVQHASESLQAS